MCVHTFSGAASMTKSPYMFMTCVTQLYRMLTRPKPNTMAPIHEVKCRIQAVLWHVIIGSNSKEQHHEAIYKQFMIVN